MPQTQTTVTTPATVDKWQAIQNFFASFSLTAYDENTVPDGAALPYLTYSVSVAALNEPVPLSASLWYRSTSWADISQKAEEISDAVGYHGVIVPYTNGRIFVTRGTPFAQRMADEDDTIRRIYLNFTFEFLSYT